MQMQGEYMYCRDRQEGQADVGLVNRFTPRAGRIVRQLQECQLLRAQSRKQIFTDRL